MTGGWRSDTRAIRVDCTCVGTSNACECRHLWACVGAPHPVTIVQPTNPGSPMVRPLAVRRHNEIVQRLRAAGSVSVGELADVFGVSHETIRRDLKLLADQGHLDVVHGGAARRGMMEPSIAQRGGENAEGKAAIARTAARMVHGRRLGADRFRHHDRRAHLRAGRPARASPSSPTRSTTRSRSAACRATA